jgi:hypothetical protein
MDTGAQQGAPDSGAPTSGAGTAEDDGASNKSAGIDNKGKGPAMPEVRTTPEPASAGQAAPAAPEQPAPKTPSTEKTPASAKPAAPTKTSIPDKTSVPDKISIPVKSGTLKIKPTKSGTPSAATAPSKAVSRPSSALALHSGKAASRPGYRPSFFDTPELEGRVSLLTKSDQSLGSLKEHCIKWNDADSMDTADSRSEKLAEASATGNPSDILAAKPIPIACELLSLQQRLHLLVDATNVSLFYIYPQSPKMPPVRDTGSRDFSIPFALSCFEIYYPEYKLGPSFKS